jgi:hypothetical protein
MVRLWRQRWLAPAEGRTVMDRLRDAEHPSAPIQFTMEQVMKLSAIACSHRSLWLSHQSLDGPRTRNCDDPRKNC